MGAGQPDAVNVLNITGREHPTARPHFKHEVSHMSAETAVPVDMNPMVTRAELLEAAHAIAAFASSITILAAHWPGGQPCPWDAKQLMGLNRRLRERAAEFDTRREPCVECGFRHTKAEGCVGE